MSFFSRVLQFAPRSTALRAATVVGLSGIAVMTLSSSQQQMAKTQEAKLERVSVWEDRWKNYTENKVVPGFHLPVTNPGLVAHFQKARAGFAKEKIFVPLCGKSLDLIYLSQFGDVFGVECAQEAIDQFAAENNLQYDEKILESSDGKLFLTTHPQTGNRIAIAKVDFFNLKPGWHGSGDKFSVTFDRASNVAIDPSLRESYAKVIAEQMTPGCKVLLMAMDYNQKEMNGPPFSLNEEQVRSLYEPYFDVAVLSRNDILEKSGFGGKLSSLHEITFILTRKHSSL